MVVRSKRMSRYYNSPSLAIDEAFNYIQGQDTARNSKSALISGQIA